MTGSGSALVKINLQQVRTAAHARARVLNGSRGWFRKQRIEHVVDHRVNLALQSGATIEQVAAALGNYDELEVRRRNQRALGRR